MSTITIRFEDESVFQRTLEKEAHPTLVDLLFWCFSSGTIEHALITSSYRKGDKGVHGTEPYRGLDIRSWDQKSPEKIAEKINAHWQYDSTRPGMSCAMLHNVGRGMHIHLQVHPNTILIKGGW